MTILIILKMNQLVVGWPSADFCPVPEIPYEEKMNNSNIDHCSNKGSGEYGAYFQNKDSSFNASAQMKLITGEINSDHSFCYLSSLISKEKKNNNYNYSNYVRAVCFETFCYNL